MIYKNKENAINNLRNGRLLSSKCFDLFKNDRDCILEALKAGKSFTHFPQEWLGDKELSKAFVTNVRIDENIHACSSIGSKLLDDKNFILSCLSNVSEIVFELMDKGIVESKEIDEIVASFSTIEKDIFARANSYYIYMAASPRLKEDKKVALYTLLDSPMSINLMSSELKTDPEILESFIWGLNSELFHTEDMSYTLRDLGLPNQHWQEHGNTEEMEEYVASLKFHSSLNIILPQKSKTQSIKI